MFIMSPIFLNVSNGFVNVLSLFFLFALSKEGWQELIVIIIPLFPHHTFALPLLFFEILDSSPVLLHLHLEFDIVEVVDELTASWTQQLLF